MGKNNFLEHAAMSLELSGEAIPGVPLVEIFGYNRVLIEHHCGIIGYDRDYVKVRTKNGSLCVSGDSVEIARMSKYQIVIVGKIKSIILAED